MILDADACCRALSTRDARFDGRLFVGVRTTGIHCRPICPAQTPKRQNLTFHSSAAAAQAAGQAIGKANASASVFCRQIEEGLKSTIRSAGPPPLLE
ncbi:MAG: hypothetical protein IIZ38_01790 [Sphingomonas sp.]|uniref:Ada metal-binding domain-containing protein n=1 Tax=Sphingomonas sp. TaxID=28214 RepID=UPI0025F1D831|nr:Ada metal-binding domain-containing protein [Sphingomonas sp.]MBQ1497024.1 hypothetical protein [Sphingomonas sp.]